jgi:hypothetical protein
MINELRTTRKSRRKIHCASSSFIVPRVRVRVVGSVGSVIMRVFLLYSFFSTRLIDSLLLLCYIIISLIIHHDFF